MMRRQIAIVYGLICHILFVVAVGLMAYSLWFGLQLSFIHIPQSYGLWCNLILLLQFPLIHSLLLTPVGRKILLRCAPGPYSNVLQTTTFAIIASIQLILVFGCWTPSGVVWWSASGLWLWCLASVFAFSWLFLLKAMSDADIRVQSGALGWWSLFRNRSPDFRGFSPRGVFLACRQPIYLAFGMVIWSAPTWTPDHALIALFWTVYLIVAPRLKERRYADRFGQPFKDYQLSVPYLFPSPRSIATMLAPATKSLGSR